MHRTRIAIMGLVILFHAGLAAADIPQLSLNGGGLGIEQGPDGNFTLEYPILVDSSQKQF